MECQGIDFPLGAIAPSTYVELEWSTVTVHHVDTWFVVARVQCMRDVVVCGPSTEHRSTMLPSKWKSIICTTPQHFPITVHPSIQRDKAISSHRQTAVHRHTKRIRYCGHTCHLGVSPIINRNWGSHHHDNCNSSIHRDRRYTTILNSHFFRRSHISWLIVSQIQTRRDGENK